MVREKRLTFRFEVGEKKKTAFICLFLGRLRTLVLVICIY